MGSVINVMPPLVLMRALYHGRPAKTGVAEGGGGKQLGLPDGV